MPISANYYVTVNGGANQQGGLEVASAAVIAFVAASTSGWVQWRWEIYDYPEGWAAPAGWSTDTDGTIYYSGPSFTPPSFTLPANTVKWGNWMMRLLLNEQLSSDTVIANLYNDATALRTLSPNGIVDIGARETAQFTTTTTKVKQWIRSYQRSMRALESLALAIPYIEIPLLAGAGNTQNDNAHYVSYAQRMIDFTILPAVVAKTVKLVATLASQGANTAISHVELWNVTRGSIVTGAALDNSGASSVYTPQTFISNALTVGSAAGNLRSDENDEYELRGYRSAGLTTDYVTCLNAHLRVTYH